jgi:hypothetical protein
VGRACLKAGWNVTPAPTMHRTVFWHSRRQFDRWKPCAKYSVQKKAPICRGSSSRTRLWLALLEFKLNSIIINPLGTSWLKITEEMIESISVSLFKPCLKGTLLDLPQGSRVKAQSRASRQGDLTVPWVFFIFLGHC